MLYQIKTILGIEDNYQDELLESLIDLCKAEAYTYCRLKEYDCRLNTIVVMMVVERFNKVNSEGLTRISTDGINEEYVDGYSKNIYDGLKKYRRIGVL